jgi:hypothetical protein
LTHRPWHRCHFTRRDVVQGINSSQRPRRAAAAGSAR